jgi:hypothetical protein
MKSREKAFMVTHRNADFEQPRNRGTTFFDTNFAHFLTGKGGDLRGRQWGVEGWGFGFFYTPNTSTAITGVPRFSRIR